MIIVINLGEDPSIQEMRDEDFLRDLESGYWGTDPNIYTAEDLKRCSGSNNLLETPHGLIVIRGKCIRPEPVVTVRTWRLPKEGQ